jgi:hypothetical protein
MKKAAPVSLGGLSTLDSERLRDYPDLASARTAAAAAPAEAEAAERSTCCDDRDDLEEEGCANMASDDKMDTTRRSVKARWRERDITIAVSRLRRYHKSSTPNKWPERPVSPSVKSSTASYESKSIAAPTHQPAKSFVTL